jgi:hypothetical protein
VSCLTLLGMGVCEQGFYPQENESEGPSRTVAAASGTGSASPERVDLRSEIERIVDEYARACASQRRSWAARRGHARRRGETE